MWSSLVALVVAAAGQADTAAFEAAGVQGRIVAAAVVFAAASYWASSSGGVDVVPGENVDGADERALDGAAVVASVSFEAADAEQDDDALVALDDGDCDDDGGGGVVVVGADRHRMGLLRLLYELHLNHFHRRQQ